MQAASRIITTTHYVLLVDPQVGPLHNHAIDESVPLIIWVLLCLELLLCCRAPSKKVSNHRDPFSLLRQTYKAV